MVHLEEVRFLFFLHHCRGTKFLSTKTRVVNIVWRFCFTVAPGNPLGPACPGLPSFPFNRDRTNSCCSCGDMDGDGNVNWNSRVSRQVLAVLPSLSPLETPERKYHAVPRRFTSDTSCRHCISKYKHDYLIFTFIVIYFVLKIAKISAHQMKGCSFGASRPV